MGAPVGASAENVGASMSLTDAAIRAALPAGKARKLFDGDGLYLMVKPNGSRHWYLKYRIDGKERKLAFGAYPEVSLKEARARRDEARRQLRDGVDPSVQARLARAARADTFKAVAEEWLNALANPPRQQKRPGKRPPRALAESTIAHKRTWLETFVYPYLGNRPIRDISAPELLLVLRKVEAGGIIETTHRVRSTCGRIFRYGIATGYCTHDLTADLRGALQPVVVTHHAALTDPREVGALLRALDGYRGEPVTRFALRLLPLVFLRSRELRFAAWPEIDWAACLWRVPGPRMKMRQDHLVPLASQSLAILSELRQFTGTRRYMFPAMGKRDRPLSENTINSALRRLGYSGDEMTGHGFRATARTLLRELGWDKDAIRVQLAHSNPDDVDAAYDRGELLAERREMMQAWADYLDGLRTSGEVVPFARGNGT